MLTFRASEMVLTAHIDAKYLRKPEAHSRAVGNFFLSSETTMLANNGAVLNIAHIIKHAMSSAIEAELALLYTIAREAVYIQIILKKMDHK